MGKVIGVLAVIAVMIIGAIGWAWNIVKLFGFDGPLAEIGMLEVLRIIGIFLAPLGAILGWM